MVKRWLTSHLGLLAALPALVVLACFPLNPNEVLPGPLEMLFDWAGMNPAMIWIGSAVFASNFGLAFVLAGMLDRCPFWHALAAIAIFCIGYIMFFLSSYAPILRLAVALLDTIYFSLAYVAVRFLSARVITETI